MLVTDAACSRGTLADYESYVGDEVVEEIRTLGRSLRGARVLHVNATAVGGGVAEMLLSIVPLMRDAGLDADWYVLEAGDAFFEVTKGYHNALQGKPSEWSPEDFDRYWSAVGRNARKLELPVHPPRPAVPDMVQ